MLRPAGCQQEIATNKAAASPCERITTVQMNVARGKSLGFSLGILFVRDIDESDEEVAGLLDVVMTAALIQHSVQPEPT